MESGNCQSDAGRPVYEEPRYALFPAQSKDKVTGKYRPIFRGGSFQIKFRCPADYEDDFNAAIRYWTNFSGIGSRTRRGLGALYCKETSGLNNFYVPADLSATAVRREWPQLKGAYLATGDPKQPLPHLQAWEKAVNLMRDFRQSRNGKMGRSLWPEPDEIRRLTGQTAAVHATPMTTAREFPRGQFGGPIIWHFRKDAHRAGDPEDTELSPVVNGKVMERMASPVILKPMAVSETHSIPICLVLNTPQPDSFDLSGHAVQTGKRDVLLELVNEAHAKWKGPYYVL